MPLKYTPTEICNRGVEAPTSLHDWMLELSRGKRQSFSFWKSLIGVLRQEAERRRPNKHAVSRRTREVEQTLDP